MHETVRNKSERVLDNASDDTDVELAWVEWGERKVGWVSRKYARNMTKTKWSDWK